MNLRLVTPDSWDAPLIISDKPASFLTIPPSQSAALSPDAQLFAHWSIMNLSRWPVRNEFKVSLLVDGQEAVASAVILSALDAFETVSRLSLALPRVEIGLHTLALIIDSGSSVPETNEFDNEYSIVFGVGSPEQVAAFLTLSPTPVVTTTPAPSATSTLDVEKRVTAVFGELEIKVSGEKVSGEGGVPLDTRVFLYDREGQLLASQSTPDGSTSFNLAGGTYRVDASFTNTISHRNIHLLPAESKTVYMRFGKLIFFCSKDTRALLYDETKRLISDRRTSGSPISYYLAEGIYRITSSEPRCGFDNIFIVAGEQKRVSDTVNRDPVISGVFASPQFIGPNQSTTITVSASDPDGDPLNYSWSSNTGTVSGTGKQVTYTAPAVAGRYRINVEVFEGRGGSARGTVLVSGVVIEVISTGDAGAPIDTRVSIYDQNGSTVAIQSTSGGRSYEKERIAWT